MNLYEFILGVLGLITLLLIVVGITGAKYKNIELEEENKTLKEKLKKRETKNFKNKEIKKCTKK
mgnify:CR=1 FL=1